MTLVIWTVSLLFGAAWCDISFEYQKRPCGEITCEYYEFCYQAEGTCRNCSKICGKGYQTEPRLCQENCQDYIHDMRYKRIDAKENVSFLQDEIKDLKVMAALSLAISIVSILIICFALLSWLYRKKKLNIFSIDRKIKKTGKKGADISRKDKPKVMEITTIQPPLDTSINMREINEIIQNNPRTPQTEYTNLTTNLSTFRNPHARMDPETPSSIYTNRSTGSNDPPFKKIASEDNTLERMGYDNHGLASSPVFDKNTSSGCGTGGSS